MPEEAPRKIVSDIMPWNTLGPLRTTHPPRGPMTATHLRSVGFPKFPSGPDWWRAMVNIVNRQSLHNTTEPIRRIEWHSTTAGPNA